MYNQCLYQTTFCWHNADMHVPFRRELYTASSFEGRFGNASSVTGYLKHDYKHPMHLTLAGGRLWRKLMSVCEHKRAPVEHIILFFPSGDLVSEVWVDMSVEKRFRRCVDPCQRCLTLDDTHDLCVMCLGEEHTRSVLEGMECVHCEPFFCGKKLRSRLSRFLERIGANICPQRLGSSRCWGSEETEFAAIADEACEWVWERGIFHLALDSGWREWTAEGRCIVCYIFWSSRKCFAGSWCA